MSDVSLYLNADLLTSLDRDSRYLSHTLVRDGDGPDFAAITIKSHSKVFSEQGDTTFFFDVSDQSFGFRWTDRQNTPRFIRYAGNSPFIKTSFDITHAAILNSAFSHFELLGKLDGVPPGYIHREALMSMMGRDDILGVSAARLEDPPGVLHLLWLDPHSPLGRKVGPDHDGDRILELKIYPEAIGFRWISPENDVRFMLISGDETSMAAMQKNTLSQIGTIISLTLGVDLLAD